MKKLIIAAVAILLLGVTIIAVPMAMRYDALTYNKDMEAHLAALEYGESAAGEHGEAKTLLSYENISAFFNAVSRSDMQREFFPPSKGDAPEVRVTFPDGAEYRVYEAKTGEDKAYVEYKYAGKTMTYSIKGYNTMSRAIECVSPEGFSGENERQ